MKTNKIYIIAYTWRDTDLTIEHFFSSSKAVRRVSDIISDDYGIKANPDDSLEEYLQGYWEWVSENNDNMCDWVITFEEIKL